MDKSKFNTTNANRRQTYIIPKRVFWQRYPMTTLWTGTITALLIFFSRPIYDAFFRKDNFIELKTSKERIDYARKQWKS